MSRHTLGSTMPSSMPGSSMLTQQRQPQNEFKGMRFCKECDNMLYPKEQIYDQQHNISKLIYDCRICGYHEKAKEDEMDNCVYRSDFNKQDKSGVFKIDPNIIKDPTLMRRNDIECRNP